MWHYMSINHFKLDQEKIYRFFQEYVVESLFIEVMLHRKTLIVGVVYCPKGINNESYNFLTNTFFKH